MANTFKKIQTVTVGSGGASSIDFTSIPQTYTDLKIVLSARTNRATFVADIVSLSFNSSTSNRTVRELYGTGTGVTSSNTTNMYAGYVPCAGATASVFGNVDVYITNYASANFKSVSVDAVSENNGTESYTNLQANLWSNTAAITSVTVAPVYGTLFAQYTTATLYGVSNVPVAEGAKATGGIITADNNYIYHTFLSSDTFTPTQSLNVDYLVVAGGGGGGSGLVGTAGGVAGGGGGGGGVRCTVGATGGGGSLESQLAVTAQAYTVTVGAGGAGGVQNTSSAGKGTNSVFGSITSTGGGGGRNRFPDDRTNIDGGSGGGNTSDLTNMTGGTGTTSQGFAGGNGSGSGTSRSGAGGGGAGAVGGNTSATNNTGNGGAGITTSISGTSTGYGGGGGGGLGGTSGGTAGTASNGGGAGGARNATGTAGTINTGGGAGGSGAGSSGSDTAGVAGGSGIVIVRYAR